MRDIKWLFVDFYDVCKGANFIFNYKMQNEFNDCFII